MDSCSTQPHTKLHDLPQSCISAILSFTTPKDTCRLAAVCKLFRSAFCSDSVWDKWLPPYYPQILSTALSPIHFSTKKDLYFRLCHPILIDHSTKMFWLERSTAKICYMVLARELSIVLGDDERYRRWLRASSMSSRFKVRGRFDCRLLSANTEYLISFLIKFGSGPSVWNVMPLKFGVKMAEGDEKECGRVLKESEGASVDPNTRIAPLIQRDDGWFEIIAGEFMIKEGAVGCIEFWMEEAKSGRWKIGLVLDGVIIRPKSISGEAQSEILQTSPLLAEMGLVRLYTWDDMA